MWILEKLNCRTIRWKSINCPSDFHLSFFNTLNNLLPITCKAHITNWNKQWICLLFFGKERHGRGVKDKQTTLAAPLRIGWMTITFDAKPLHSFTFAYRNSKYFDQFHEFSLLLRTYQYLSWNGRKNYSVEKVSTKQQKNSASVGVCRGPFGDMMTGRVNFSRTKDRENSVRCGFDDWTANYGVTLKQFGNNTS